MVADRQFSLLQRTVRKYDIQQLSLLKRPMSSQASEDAVLAEKTPRRGLRYRLAYGNKLGKGLPTISKIKASREFTFPLPKRP